MYTYYIGKNTDWINRISHCLDCQVLTFNNPIKAILYIHEQSKKDVSPAYVFIESYNKTRNLRWLEAIKQSNLKNTYLLLLSEKVSKEDIATYLLSGASEIININTTPEDLQTVLTVLPQIRQHSTTNTPNNPRRFKLPCWKRAFDILFSGTAIVCLSPLLIVTAVAIRVESKGPIIYKSKRVGSNYDIFDFLKFRSMYIDAEARKKELMAQNEMDGPVFKIKDDPRITRVGKFIRKTSIDELPQLWNILKGDMSIVGPRPALPREVEQYGDYEKQRLYVTPGLSCYWQIAPHRNELSFEEWMNLDIKYVQERSFWVDWKIIFKTFKVCLLGHGE